MKNFFKPARIAFYILMLVSFFIAGLYFAGLIDAGKGQGLAGGAIVLGYGVLFGGIAFIASFFIAHFIPHKYIVYANIILLGIVLVAYGITHYRYIQRQNANSDEIQPKPIPAVPKPQTEPIGMVSFYKHDATYSKPVPAPAGYDDEIGIGFFKPNFFQHPTLYFYGNVTLEKAINQHTPVDSLALGRDSYGDFTLISAPPWLWPQAMNQPFGIFYFKVLSVGREFIEVEVNSKTGRTAHLNKQHGELLFWPEFLLTVTSIEFKEGNAQRPKIKPLDIAVEIKTPFSHLSTLQVKDDWAQVILKDKKHRKLGKGWVRWQKDGKLLITYQLPNIAAPR